MNKLIALCYFVLSLYGCDAGQSTFVHRSSVDGRATLDSKVVAQPGVARFDCLRSASGQCHYTLFPAQCAAAPASPSAGVRSVRCPAAPVRRFAVADGASRQIPGLAGFRVCVSAEGRTPRPDCGMPGPIAAR